MSLIYEERLSDSPYVDRITTGHTISNGSTIRPAEIHWHLVIVNYQGHIHPIVTGPLTTSGRVTFTEGAEILWIKFKLGTFMPHLPPRKALDAETMLPTASNQAFWLKGSTWQLPNFNNVETFITRLVRDEILVRDPLVLAALNDQLPQIPERTVRHRFLQATGLTQTHIRQFERAQQAAVLLQQGVPIFDVIDRLGYYDQPHLTRSLKRFIGKTPAQQLVRLCQREPLAIPS